MPASDASLSGETRKAEGRERRAERSRAPIAAAAVVAASILAASGCASSVLIREDDQAFQRATRGLARTQELTAASGAPVDEQTRFLQAEAFYRYRFAFPSRGVGAHLAQAGAVFAELPVLQDLAASLDMRDLRLRSYDGAVQLWESLLAARPETKLRELTLYRLGWAYRSGGISGLPRESGDEAFDRLIADHPTSPLASLAREAKAVSWKSKRLATELSLLPGAGQIYSGEKASGAIRALAAFVAAAAILVPIGIAYERRNDLSWGRDWPLLATSLGGLFLLSIDYTISYQDALRAVVEFNEREETAFQKQHPDAP